MDHQAPPCPKCQSDSSAQLPMSEIAWVTYYRCERCGHVWNVPKAGGPARDVTHQSPPAKRA
jgi:hypothetical protein